MKRLLLLLLFVPFMGGWLDTDSPEGHIESVAHGQADGQAIPYTALTLSSLFGTGHKGGLNQAEADAKGVVGSAYIAWDRDSSGAIDAADEPPNASTTLTAGIDGVVTTIPVAATTYFYPDGFVVIDSELISYTGKTATSLTGCVRGVNESDPAAHLADAAVTERIAFALWFSTAYDGSPCNARGYDGGQADTGTEGQLNQASTAFQLVAHRSYIVKWRVVDGSGNTNTEVTGSDVFATFGAACYLGRDGDSAQGLEDDEVWGFTTSRFPE